MLEIKKSCLLGACAVIVVGGIVVHHLGSHHAEAETHHQPGHVISQTGTPVAPPPSRTATQTSTVGTGKPMSVPWQTAGLVAMEHHFDEQGLGWQWIVPGAPNAYLFLNPSISNGQIQYGIEAGSQWSFGGVPWPTSGVLDPQINKSNPLTYAIGLMTPLIGNSGSAVSSPVTADYQGSSIGLQLYKVQTAEQYQLQGVTALNPSAGGVDDITFQVESKLPPNLLGPVYYNSQGQVVQDLVFQFQDRDGHWAWIGFQENPVAVNLISEMALAPSGPVS